MPNAVCKKTAVAKRQTESGQFFGQLVKNAVLDSQLIHWPGPDFFVEELGFVGDHCDDEVFMKQAHQVRELRIGASHKRGPTKNIQGGFSFWHWCSSNSCRIRRQKK